MAIKDKVVVGCMEFWGGWCPFWNTAHFLAHKTLLYVVVIGCFTPEISHRWGCLIIPFPRQAPKAGVLPLHHAPVRGTLYHSDG